MWKAWLPPILCCILYAAIAALYFEHSAHGFHHSSDLVLLGTLSAAAGVCSLAGAFWSAPSRERWPWLLSGLALLALGLVLDGVTGPRVSLRLIALLVMAMAAGTGTLEVLTAARLRTPDRRAGRLLLRIGGALSLGFAGVFVAFAFRRIAPHPNSAPEIVWLGALFGFTALCMLALSLVQPLVILPSEP